MRTAVVLIVILAVVLAGAAAGADFGGDRGWGAVLRLERQLERVNDAECVSEMWTSGDVLSVTVRCVRDS